MSSVLPRGIKLRIEDRPSSLLDLPDELLCIILAIIAEAEPPCKWFCFNGSARRDAMEVLGFLRLSEVCTRVRALLLSMSTVWADVAFILPVEPGKLALVRSQSAPLPVIIANKQLRELELNRPRKTPDDIFEHLVAVASSHAARVRLIETRSLPTVYYGQLFDKQLPLLKSLQFYFAQGYARARQPSRHEHICVDTPLLQRASFVFETDACYSFFHQFGKSITFRFPALQELQLCFNCADSYEEIRPDWIIDVLKTVPLLVSLDLTIYTSCPLINWPVLVHDNCQLPHLRSLELDGPPNANIPGLYKHLDSSRPARSAMELIPSPDADQDDEGGAMNFAETFGPLLQRPPWDCLLVRIDGTSDCPTLQLCLFMSQYNSEEDFDKWKWTRSISGVVDLTIACPASPDSPIYKNIVDVLVKNIQPAIIKRLIVQGSGLDVWPCAIQSIASACTAVTELVIVHRSSSDSLNFDFPMCMLDGMFPALETMYFNPWPLRKSSSSSVEVCHSSWEGLIVWLGWRARTGHRIACLHIQGPLWISRTDTDAVELAGREIYTRVAGLVDKLVDDRVRRVYM